MEQLPLAVGTEVFIRKLRASDNPEVEAGSWDQWKLGQQNPWSLPVSYELRGVLINPVKKGAAIEVLRNERNGVAALGVFNSTLVCDLPDEETAVTLNSVYLIRPVVGEKSADESV